MFFNLWSFNFEIALARLFFDESVPVNVNFNSETTPSPNGELIPIKNCLLVSCPYNPRMMSATPGEKNSHAEHALRISLLSSGLIKSFINSFAIFFLSLDSE